MSRTSQPSNTIHDYIAVQAQYYTADILVYVYNWGLLNIYRNIRNR